MIAGLSERAGELGDDDDPVETLAAIFGRAVLRLRRRDVVDGGNPGNSGVHGLALCSTSCPCVVDGSESRQKEQA